MNVTYLLGAGASANALPTYENFKSRYDRFLAMFHDSNLNALNEFERRFSNDIYSAGEIFSKEFVFHNTPDTIAKKYFHTGDGNLKLLKKILILFFLYEQTFISKGGDGFFDKRYDALIATILKPIANKIEIENQLSIITWNYDLQFEIAFLRYYPETLNEVQRKIQGYPKLFESTDDFKVNKFSINHLNGIAYAKPTNQGDSIGKTINEVSSLQKYLVDVWSNLTEANLLSFAWENINEDYSLKQNEVLENALKVAKKTEVLAVIGYSFPIFNRIIDKQLFDELKKLRTIYIQSPQSKEIQNILETDLVRTSKDYLEVDYKDVGYWNQFYIPHEWSS